ncbi:MAG: pyrroline-5-carboxylate reductase [FCB group bacterium]|nr:pyrroline-5-carboxylate reductase [FCB group bacterium]
MSGTENWRPNRIAVLGAGNIGQAIAKGLVRDGLFLPAQITLTRRNTELLAPLGEKGFVIQADNVTAVKEADLVIVAVGPREIEELLREIAESLVPGRQILVSTVTGVTIEEIKGWLATEVPVVRIMPNTAIAVGESMTCLTSYPEYSESLLKVKSVFEKVGHTLVISEELMTPATALGASGLAFFLRSIRAASQGGTEIGFHAEDAIQIAAQTAKGAASLLLNSKTHPEAEIDNVTTPRGITIAGLNEMEHQGFSSAMIKGIVTSANKVARLFNDKH